MIKITFKDIHGNLVGVALRTSEGIMDQNFLTPVETPKNYDIEVRIKRRWRKRKHEKES